MQRIEKPKSVSTMNASIFNTSSSMVKIISQETIKPSSPTPHHLKTYKLSLLDHLTPPIYIPFILFYAPTDVGRHNDDHHHLLKQSLAETLTSFYPLAGTMKCSQDGFLYIDCTDDGVDYLEARVNAQLHETIKDPDGNLLNQFLPLKPYQIINRKPKSEYGSSSQPVLAVQVSTFDCGGIAVGVSISHEVSDTTALIQFIQAWADNTHGAGSGTSIMDINPPLIGGFETLFPTRALPALLEYPSGLLADNIVTKRFVIDSSEISALREKVIILMNDGSYLTRVESVSAFIWRCFTNIHRAKVRPAGQNGSLHFICVTNTANLRKRMNLPQNSFGNLFLPTFLPLFSIDGSEKEHDCFVSRSREIISKINGNYVQRELESGEDGKYLKFAVKVVQSYGNELETLNFTSWCRMGYYKVDFGWGKPIWVSPGTMPVKNLVVLTDTKCGDGIEVWVNMTREDIDALEHDPEFLAFVS